MKMLIIGGNGTIGKNVTAHFKVDNDVLVAGRNSGDVTVDISDADSIEQMFEDVGKIDAIICIAGEAKWGDFKQLKEEDYYIGIKNKLMGQVNVARIGLNYLNPHGSITLSSGSLADDPVPQSTIAAMVNGGINSFVQAVAMELKDGTRINAVATDVVVDSYEKYKDAFVGHEPVPMEKVVNAYVTSVQESGNGKIIKVTP